MSMTLKAARINKGLSQEEAAKLLKVSIYTLRNYESGKFYPDVPTIKLIQTIYGVDFNDIDFLCD